MTTYGWDASDYDWARGPMDLVAAKSDGIDFFTHKATEGTSIVHTHYRDALNRARAAGIALLGAYVVPRTPGVGGHGSVAAQCSYFLSYLDAQTPWWRTAGNFFLQVDLEKWTYDAVSPTTGATMCDILRAATGKTIALYAPQWAYGDAAPRGYPLWASSYVSGTTGYRAAYPGDGSARWVAYSGQTPVILQYGSTFTIGSQPMCDANAFRGTLAQLTAILAPASVPTVPERNSMLVLVSTAKTGQPVYLSDGMHRRVVPPSSVANVQWFGHGIGASPAIGPLANGGEIVVVGDLDAFGPVSDALSDDQIATLAAALAAATGQSDLNAIRAIVAAEIRAVKYQAS